MEIQPFAAMGEMTAAITAALVARLNIVIDEISEPFASGKRNAKNHFKGRIYRFGSLDNAL